MNEYVQRGPTEHPGAKYIIHEDGTRIDLRYSRAGADVQLQPGFIIERHIQDDDLIIFNRQPTLHKMSMMGHRVKVSLGCSPLLSCYYRLFFFTLFCLLCEVEAS